MSDKAKLVYATMELLGAIGEENKITSYKILDFIIEETDKFYEHELTKDIDEDTIENFAIDASIKSINTTVISLVRKGVLEKTNPSNIKVEGTTRYLRQYYIKK